MFIGFQIQFGFVLPLIGIIIYLKDRVFQSKFFTFYYWYRLILVVLQVILLLGLFFFAFSSDSEAQMQQMRPDIKVNLFQVILLCLVYLLVILWLFQTSVVFRRAIREIQEKTYQQELIQLADNYVEAQKNNLTN